MLLHAVLPHPGGFDIEGAFQALVDRRQNR
jgi:hypothetical protein